MAAGIIKTPIYALAHGRNDYLIVAIIIAKKSPRTIKSKSDGSSRSVWNFTVRDSPGDYINASFWGTPQFMESMACSFHIGDIIDIIKAKTTYARTDDSNFMPNVTSPLMLSMSEGMSEMCLHSEQDCPELLRLLRLPTRPPGDRLTLSDIQHHAQALRGKHVNLLVAVSFVGAIRQIKSKQDRQLECREVEIMDDTCSTGLTVQIWDSEVAYRADHWKPRETILFIADVKLDWSNYHKRMCATVNGRTVITENPDCQDVAQLRDYARTAPIRPTAILNQLAANFPDPATINTVMSCDTAWTKATNGEFGESFTALVLAAVVEFDLDGLYPLTATKWYCPYFREDVHRAIYFCSRAVVFVDVYVQI